MRARLAFGFVALAVVLGMADRESPRAGAPLRMAGQPLAFSAGQAVDGLPLTAVLTREDTGSVSFVYGDCVPDDDAGCPPPAEVQVWPACRRSLASYERDAYSPRPVPAVLRGAPAASSRTACASRSRREPPRSSSSETRALESNAWLRLSRVSTARCVPGAVEGRLGC